MESKKAVMGPVISVFVLVLIISILAGLTFLFVSALKTTTINTSTKTSFTTVNESGSINSSGYTVANAGALDFSNFAVVQAINSSSNKVIVAANYTVNSDGTITNATAISWSAVKFTYTYTAIGGDDAGAYNAVNGTEAAGVTVVSYLPLIFLAVIFGAILTLVLRIIIPYINLGNQLGSGF